MYRPQNPYGYGGNQPALFDVKNLSFTQQILFVIASVGGLGFWFLTPMSDYVADGILMFVPMEADIQLGREALYSLSRDSQLRTVRDRYGVEKAGWELITASDASNMCPECKWDFGVVRADYMNAFALPGGVVRVTDTLASQLTSNELKALIGHEVGHVLHRHSQRRMIKHDILKYVASALVYDDKDNHRESFGEAVGEIMLTGAKFLGEQGFSRKDEYEADEKGWRLLEQAATDPRAMITMLKKLWRASGDSGETRWESTHPGTKDRIKALEEKWENMSSRDRRAFERRRRYT